jgi:hypothetical protein
MALGTLATFSACRLPLGQDDFAICIHNGETEALRSGGVESRHANQWNENLSGKSTDDVHTEQARLVAVGFVFQLPGKT